MATVSQGRRNTYGRTYVEGNTVRKLQEMPAGIPNYAPKKLSNAARKNREKAAHMSLPYVTFLVVAIVITGFSCIMYLRLQADITARQKTIARMESTYNDLKLQNDEEYARIMGSVDLEKVKEIAMNELGMTYPTGDQIIGFSGEDSDYVRQYKDIPLD